MENSLSNLPPLPTPEEVEREQSKAASATVNNPFCPDDMINLDNESAELEKDLVTSKTEVPPPQPIIEVDGHGIFTKSDIHLVKAKAKAGKTSMLKIVATALILGAYFRLRAVLENLKIVWFDTEQSMADTYRIIADIIRMSGKSPDEVEKRLKVYHLRRYFYDELRNKLVTALNVHKPDVVIIDGVVDMVESFNDERESRQFLRVLLSLSEQFDCSIINVLHTNMSQEVHKPRGHLGTNATNASETVLECEKNNDIFTVKCTDSRHEGMPTWYFMYDANGNIVDGSEQHSYYVKSEDEKKNAEKSKEVAKQVADMLNIINKNGGRMKRSKLKEAMIESCGFHRTRAYGFINEQIGKTIFADGDFVQVSPQTQIQFEPTSE